MKELVQKLGGTIVECNTTYNGKRDFTEDHKKVIKDHGFYDIAKVDIMDSEGEEKLPVKNGKHLKYNLVGTHLKNIVSAICGIESLNAEKIFFLLSMKEKVKLYVGVARSLCQRPQ